MSGKRKNLRPVYHPVDIFGFKEPDSTVNENDSSSGCDSDDPKWRPIGAKGRGRKSKRRKSKKQQPNPTESADIGTSWQRNLPPDDRNEFSVDSLAMDDLDISSYVSVVDGRDKRTTKDRLEKQRIKWRAIQSSARDSLLPLLQKRRYIEKVSDSDNIVSRN
jgi:hypothetical protein